MSDKTRIEWTATRNADGTVTPGATWNPIRGQNARHTCARISPGCDNCYAATMTRRGLGGTAAIDYGRGETPNDPARLDEKALMQPHRWRQGRTIFVCSMTDIAGAWVDFEWFHAMWTVMAETPRHTYQVLTKRPARLKEFIERFQTDAPGFGPYPLPNVWIGTSIEANGYAWRANVLRQTPAAIRWISAEPLLGPLDSLDLTGIDWLVAGGESGPGARPMHPDWPRDLRDRCAAAGTAYFFKQWGAWTPDRSGQIALSRNRSRYDTQTFTPDGVHYEPYKPDLWHLPGMTTLYRKGNHLTGRELDGRTWDEYPRTAAGHSSGVPEYGGEGV